MTTPVTTLEHVEAYAPGQSVAIEDVAETLRLNRHQTRLFRRIHGLDRFRRDPGSSLFDLVRVPAESVLARVPDPSVIRYVIFAHTIQEVTPAGIDAAAVIAESLGLKHADAFALTQQNCASGLAAVDVAGELLRADGDPQARALVVTGEKTFAPMAHLIANTTIMGEASTASLVGLTGPGLTGPGLRVRSYAVRTDGRYADGLRLAPKAHQEFCDTYTERLGEVIEEALQQAGLTLGQITLVLPHNVNRSSWLSIMRHFDLAPERIYLDNVPRYGHCFCSDPFLNLVTLRDEGRLIPSGHYLLTAVGLGATYAAMIVDS